MLLLKIQGLVNIKAIKNIFINFHTLKKGDKIKILSTSQMIVVDKIKHLTNGKAVVLYHFINDNKLLIQGEVYLEVLEMMGIQMQED